MIRLDLSYFYGLSLQLAPLRTLAAGQPLSAAWVDLFTAQNALHVAYNNAVMAGSLRASQVAARTLYDAIGQLIEKNASENVSQFEAANLASALDRLESVLRGELGVMDAYLVTDKAPFATLTLVSGGEALFPPDVLTKVPEAAEDLRSAGKCLAFELSTACGFHTMRALEAVLRRYWEHATNNKPHPKQRNMGVYLRLMEQYGCGTAVVRATLAQIKDLHRNGINHPDSVLDVEQAKTLLGIARSAASAMLKELPEPTPKAPAVLDGG
ncbi:MAG TPA: hypothetical protein VGL58_06980 [Caulobacteraceae bacterium]|jgi:hypothetical protein